MTTDSSSQTKGADNGAPAGPKIALIIGSVRGVRIGPSVASWLTTLFTSQLTSIPTTPTTTGPPTIDIIDLKSINLPIFTEPIIPAMVPTMASFTTQPSRDWSALISSYSAYIILSPEYNRGMPGALKNAIDHLYNEWSHKPVLIITYGIFGGATASEQLKTSLGVPKCDVVETRPRMEFPGKSDGEGVMTEGLGKAMGGELTEEVRKAWEETYGEELEKGFEELIEKLENRGKETKVQV